MTKHIHNQAHNYTAFGCRTLASVCPALYLSMKSIVASALAIFTLINSQDAYASEDIPLHSHYVEIEGVLPSPYEHFEFRIRLDHETDNVIYLMLKRGEEKIIFPNKYLGMLKDVELSTLKLSHGIHRDENDQPYPGTYDAMYIYLEMGEYRKVEKEEAGVVSFKRGRDRITLYVTKDNEFGYFLKPLSEQNDGWYTPPKI